MLDNQNSTCGRHSTMAAYGDDKYVLHIEGIWDDISPSIDLLN